MLDIVYEMLKNKNLLALKTKQYISISGYGDKLTVKMNNQNGDRLSYKTI